MKLYIKYMVSLRCKMVVMEEVKKLGLHLLAIDLGMVEVEETIEQHQHEQLKKNLLKSGLELLDDKRSILIEKIKNLIVEMIHYSDEIHELNLTEISYKLHYSSVAHLSNQFKKVTGLSPSFYKQLKQKRKDNLENM